MDDCDHILQASRDLVRRSNCILQTFTGVDPFMKTKLLNAFCLSLYCSSLWKLSCKSISIIEVSLNKVVRKVWHLPWNSHSYCIALPGFTASLMLSILDQGSYFTVPFVPLHQLFDVFSWILCIYVILLLATTPSMGTAILRNIIQRTSYVLM